ncbi:MAG: trifunctional histidinol dehydrogenase [Phylliscum demangeonii]|nr:MAG: trifunctional histidinol dehydrogenase [Phylliscum demangeonii]
MNMNPPVLAAVELPYEPGTPRAGLDLRTISYLGGLFCAIDPPHLADGFRLIALVVAQYGVQCAVHVEVTALASVDDVLALLDAGAAKAFVSPDQWRALLDQGRVERDRLVWTVPGPELAVREWVPPDAGPRPVATYWKDVDDFAAVEVLFPPASEGETPMVYISGAGAEAADREESPAPPGPRPIVPIIPAARLTAEATPEPTAGLVPVTALLRLRSDRDDGLLSTVVSDERGVALGLVYSSLASIQESLRTGRGVYHSRKRGLWYKGESSGNVQELVRIRVDCDYDCLQFVVRQQGEGFCHLATTSCFGPAQGLARLQQTLQKRQASAPPHSYTHRLFSSPALLRAKIMEEAEELCAATTAADVAAEAADLIYFALTKCVAAGVTLEDVESNLDAKALKVTRRPGDAKGRWAAHEGLAGNGDRPAAATSPPAAGSVPADEAPSAPAAPVDEPTGAADGADGADGMRMRCYDTATASADTIREALRRPSQRSSDAIMKIVAPIIQAVRDRGDAALLEYTHRFDRATSLTTSVLHAPFAEADGRLAPETQAAIDTSFDNIYRFHAAQRERQPLEVETMPGVVCRRFARAIERVGLYVPGGTAVLPSTALMLGVPARVAGCATIVLASPPRPDGSISPEIVYIARKIGASHLVLAGGAQAVAALAYGTATVPKVDKILGPGNQYVTAAKVAVATDGDAGVSIDMPAGPSEVLVVADATARPAFVAADLLSQAEHGPDSQVVLIAIDLTAAQLAAIEAALDAQARALPRAAIVRAALRHSVTLRVPDLATALAHSNAYAPEHLILHVAAPDAALARVQHAGSVFLGPWTPESVGDYSAGVNHALPTSGYARQYSGVSVASFVKHLTSAQLSPAGLRNVSSAVMRMAAVEQLEAHRRAVAVRLEYLDREREGEGEGEGE